MRPKLPAMLAIAASIASSIAVLPFARASAQDDRGTAPAVEPEISITATVRARSVTFHSKPDVQVELTGTPGRLDVDQTLRDNLPEDIEPRRTYRDVGVRFEASTTLDPAAVEPLRVDVDVDPLPPPDEAQP